MATSLMVEAGVSVRRAQEIVGHASERTTLSIYRHTLRPQHDDTAELIAVEAGAAAAPRSTGSSWKQSSDK
jgi:integrase